MLLVGKREPLKRALLGALERAFAPTDPVFAAKLLTDLKATTVPDDLPNDLIVRRFETAAVLACKRGYARLVVIIDEFGKLLEYAAQQPASKGIIPGWKLPKLSSKLSIGPVEYHRRT